MTVPWKVPLIPVWNPEAPETSRMAGPVWAPTLPCQLAQGAPPLPAAGDPSRDHSSLHTAHQTAVSGFPSKTRVAKLESGIRKEGPLSGTEKPQALSKLGHLCALGFPCRA